MCCAITWKLADQRNTWNMNSWNTIDWNTPVHSFLYQESDCKHQCRWSFDVSVDGHTISRDNTLKILGVTLDDKLNFKAHIRNICQTASCQINALKRISKFVNEHCRLSVYKSFINANFNYCPIVWMFCGKTNLNRLEKLQERALATVYGDNSLNYDDMLQRSGQLRLRINLMRLVAIEIFKCVYSTGAWLTTPTDWWNS